MKDPLSGGEGGDSSILALGGDVAAERPGKEATRRGGARPPKAKKVKAVEREKVSFHLSTEVLTRLDLHCAVSRERRNDVVESILLRYMKDRGKGQKAIEGEVAEEPKAPPPDLSRIVAEAKGSGDQFKARMSRFASAASSPDTREDRQDSRAS